MIKYALHPDFVMSRSDGDIHYISAEYLAHLYQLAPDEYMVIDDSASRHVYVRAMRAAESMNLTHLYPRYDGDYRLPK